MLGEAGFSGADDRVAGWIKDACWVEAWLSSVEVVNGWVVAGISSVDAVNCRFGADNLCADVCVTGAETCRSGADI